ncbi:hypothetical protein APB26_32625 [Pseudomonas aeruginosa]|uniref:hypothetical protein n=1 Tax=Pseudomonas aeruginosa TaxID=287 RepID=UPI00071BEEF7|nr:hypothetical protein [Pseudomonas aeruginosa]KSQ21728.1 hypothetical protein APB26_32625 [Pseudomonas aeruginosa]RPV61401.1 hypothetical protein IPC838_18965 [Pseudomonas aeruginosa]
MNRTFSNRPSVSLEQIHNDTGDITHCLITVGNQTIEAPFNIGHMKLEELVEEATGVVLNTPEHMFVTRSSRAQMEREGGRLADVLRTLPAGTVARVQDDLYFWIGAKGYLLWVEYLPIGAAPEEINPGQINEFGEIDTDDLYEVAVSIREWLSSPKQMVVDLEWLRSVEPVDSETE